MSALFKLFFLCVLRLVGPLVFWINGTILFFVIAWGGGTFEKFLVDGWSYWESDNYITYVTATMHASIRFMPQTILCQVENFFRNFWWISLLYAFYTYYGNAFYAKFPLNSLWYTCDQCQLLKFCIFAWWWIIMH